MTTILAIDPSLASTGLVAWRDGRFHVATITTTPTAAPEERHHAIAMRILAMRDTTGPTLAVIEGRITPPPEAVEVAMDLAELRGVILHGLHQCGIPVAAVHPGTLKVYATGNGRASKQDMVVAARGRLGAHLFVANDDEADAAWLLALALEHYGQPLCPLPRKNRTAVAKPKWPPFTLPAMAGAL